MVTPTSPSSMHTADEEHVPVLDESLRSGAHTVSEEVIPLVEELAHADVQREIVEVTRVPIDRMVETAPEIRTEGDVTILPVVEEVLVVEKRLVLKEEVHIRRRVTTETAEVPVTLRKQRVEVERIDPDKPTGED
jgi:stress response protein YsnF